MGYSEVMITDYTLKMFNRIRYATDAFLVEASSEQQKLFVGDAINWGDLSCRRVLWCLADDGDSWYEVEIEEVAPEAQELQKWISAKFEQQGIAVRVRTAW